VTKKKKSSVFPDSFVMGTSTRDWTPASVYPTFEMHQEDSRWFWRLVATNGHVLAFGDPAGYTSKATCQELKRRIAVDMRESKEVEVENTNDRES